LVAPTPSQHHPHPERAAATHEPLGLERERRGIRVGVAVAVPRREVVEQRRAGAVGVDVGRCGVAVSVVRPRLPASSRRPRSLAVMLRRLAVVVLVARPPTWPPGWSCRSCCATPSSSLGTAAQRSTGSRRAGTRHGLSLVTLCPYCGHWYPSFTTYFV
jgi:hypothetical protein